MSLKQIVQVQSNKLCLTKLKITYFQKNLPQFIEKNKFFCALNVTISSTMATQIWALVNLATKPKESVTKWPVERKNYNNMEKVCIINTTKKH